MLFELRGLSFEIVDIDWALGAVRTMAEGPMFGVFSKLLSTFLPLKNSKVN